MSTGNTEFSCPPYRDSPIWSCATQRSGSTLLCESLRATGVAGRPLEHFQIKRATGRPPQPREYFDGLDDARVLARLAPTPAPDPPTEPSSAWWARVLVEGSTENGVWAGKLMWDQVGDLTSHFREVLRDPGATLRDGIDQLLGDTRMVFVTRADKVAQAVSLWKAVQTQEWREDGEDSSDTEIEYSFAGIGHLADWLTSRDDAWRAWFTEQEIDPLTVSYERAERRCGRRGAGRAALPGPARWRRARTADAAPGRHALRRMGRALPA